MGVECFGRLLAMRPDEVVPIVTITPKIAQKRNQPFLVGVFSHSSADGGMKASTNFFSGPAAIKVGKWVKSCTISSDNKLIQTCLPSLTSPAPTTFFGSRKEQTLASNG